MELGQLSERVGELEARLLALENEVRQLVPHPIAPGSAPVIRPAIAAPDVLPAFEPIMSAPAQTEEIKVERRRFAAARPSLESRIGKNFAGWVGAIVLVLGVGFFLKYAWEHEWINPSPVGRVVSAVLLGMGLAGMGEWLYRKPMRGLAAVLYAAGVATVMTAFFAAHAYFSPAVLDATTAAILVLATAAGGIVLALRADLAVMAILSLLGAYISPAILHSHADQSLTLLCYVGALCVTGWVLCLFRPRWNSVRGFVFTAGWIWYAVWYAQLGDRHAELAFAYLSFIYAGTLGEIFVTIQRQFRDAPHAAAALGTELARVESCCAVLSFLNTALISGALYVLYRHNLPLAGSLALGLAAVQGVVALAAFSRQLRYSAILQMAALVTVAVPLLLSQFSINLAWLVMGVGLAILNRRLDLRWLRAWAAALWLLVVVKLIGFDFFDSYFRVTLLSIGAQPVSRWLLMAWMASIAAHALALLGPRRVAEDSEGVLLAWLGTFLFLGVTATGWGAGSVTTLAGILWLVCIIGLQEQGRRVAYVQHAWMLAGILAVKWFVYDGIGPAVAAYTQPAADAYFPVINLPALCAGLLIAVFIYLAQTKETFFIVGRTSRVVGMTAVIAIAFLLINFEILRTVDHFAGSRRLVDVNVAKQVSLSILWSVTSLCAITIGFTRRLAIARYAGLALLGVTLVKILSVDMADVETIWRILSFTAVGAMLMCVSFVYYKHLEGKVPPGGSGELPL